MTGHASPAQLEHYHRRKKARTIPFAKEFSPLRIEGIDKDINQFEKALIKRFVNLD